MFRRLAIQSLEDRRLLAAQPVLSASSILQALVQPAIESRLENAEVSADLQASAARERLESAIAAGPLVREQISHRFSQAADGLSQLAIADLFRANPDGISASARELPSIADRVQSRLGPLRPWIQEALSSPPLSETSQELSEARRELLEISEQLLGRAIEQIDASRLLDGRIAANLEAPPTVTEAIRTQVRDRLETGQITIASILEANESRQGQPLALTDTPVQPIERTDVFHDWLQFDFDSRTHEAINADLEASYTPIKQLIAGILDLSTADSIEMDELLAPKSHAPLHSQAPSGEPVDATVADRSDTFFAEYAEPAAVHRGEHTAGIEIGGLIGRVSSLDLLSALDATASEIRATVDEIRPRISVSLAASISALTVSFLVRTQKRRLKNLKKEIDVECPTVKLADKVPQPTFGM